MDYLYMQVFTWPMYAVCELEGKQKPLPNYPRWAMLKFGQLAGK
jgi:hypothetical protein